MRKGISTFRCFASLVILFLLLIFVDKPVSAVTVLETDVDSAAGNCTMFGVYGSYYSDAQAALNRMNEIRKEACEAGNVPDPRNPSRMLTPDDYVPIKWSKDLESIARIRAMEGGLAYGFYGSGHNRLNGRNIWGVSYGGVSSCAEILAYNWGNTMVQGVEQWYGEMDDWVQQKSGAVTGHYTIMINPGNTYVGLGDFYTKEAPYPNTVSGAFSQSSSNLDMTMQPAQTNVMQKIEVLNSYITGYVLEGTETIYTDRTTTLTPRVVIQNGTRTYKLWLLDEVTFVSSDTSVATVSDDGVVTGLRNGKTTITAKVGDKELASVSITVKCDHAKELIEETPATCIRTGVRIYGCEVCGGNTKQEIPLLPHDYVYSEANAEGYRTGICSGCGDTIQIVPPTTFALYWNTTGSGTYTSVFPYSAPIGSTVYCWLYGVNGDSNYRDMVIESTDESVVSVPEVAVANSHTNQLKFLSPGIVTLTFYPKYNPGLKKTILVRLGEEGSVDITKADVTLSQTKYEYTGSACTPTVSVSYHDTVLEKGRDYTVSYANNINKGKATVQIKGCGIFAGTISKNYTIENVTEEEKPGSGSENTTKEKEEHKKEALKVGKIFVVKKISYKVVKSDAKKGVYQVSCIKPAFKNITKLTLSSYVTYNGVKYKVVSVGKNAFSGCKKLKSVTLPSTINSIGAKAFYNCKALANINIKSVSLTSKKIGTNAFKGIKSTASIKVPKKKYSTYKSLLRKKGVSKKAKFKKI